MGFHGTMRVQDLFDDAPLHRAQRRITERVGAFAKDRAAHHSPVAKAPEGVSTHEFVEGRHGRVRGTLRNSWRVGGVKVLPDGSMLIDVYSLDPIAPLVEDDTQPHLIRPKKARVLALVSNGQVRFATIVHHPGTSGQHMLKIAMLEARAELHRIGEQELASWARGRYHLRTGAR